MKQEEMILGECYILQRGNNDYKWLTINCGGYNTKGNICFYPDGSKNPYFEKDANFGKNYDNFRGQLIAIEPTPLEKEWLSLCWENKTIMPTPTTIRQARYEIY